MGRKNAKTTLSACLLLLHLVGPEARENSQLYSGAQSRDQAALLFTAAAKMIRLNPELSAYCIIRDTAKQLLCPDLGTLYRALSADASTSYGINPAFAVHDELGQVRGPRSELYEAIETAAGAQEEPLSIVISTQAPTDADLLSVLIDDAKTGRDPKVKLFLWTAPAEADPFSEAAIRAANPAFDRFMNKAEVMAQAAAAKRMPSREASYRNLILNQRVNMHQPFIPRVIWEACAGPATEEVFLQGPCFLGLDLSAIHDLTALVMVALEEATGFWHVRPFFWAPQIGVHDRALRDRTPYDVWAQQGHLELTPGASVDYEPVCEKLIELCDHYPVQIVGYDRWRIDVLKAALARVGRELPLQPMGQGFKDMPPAIDFTESALLNGKMRHGGHPVLRWCAANAVVISDAAGNRKLDKSKATGRIDGMVALVIAMGKAQTMTDQASAFDEFLANPVRA